MKRAIAILVMLSCAIFARAGIYSPLAEAIFKFAEDGTAEPLSPSNFSLLYDDRINTMNPATPPERAKTRIAALKRIEDNKTKPIPQSAEDALARSADLLMVGQPTEAIKLLRSVESSPDFRLIANSVQAYALSNDWIGALENHEDPKGADASAVTPELRWRYSIEKKYKPMWLRYHRDLTRNKPDPTTLKPITLFGDGPLPVDAVAIVQQMALDAPTDIFLLWTLADVTARAGDYRTAERIFDRCTNSGLTQPKALMARRAEVQDLAAKLPKIEDGALLPSVVPPPEPPKGLFDLINPTKFILLSGAFLVIAAVLLGLQIRAIRKRRPGGLV